MANINNIVMDRRTNTFKILDHNGEDLLEIDSSNELKIGRGNDKKSLVSNAGIPQNLGNSGGGGASGNINCDSLELGQTLEEAAIIVNLPCQYSDFPNPTIDRLILTIDSTGRVRPIAYTDNERCIVVGVSMEPVVEGQTSLKVAIGGVVSLTPHNGQTPQPGDYLERNNQGPPPFIAGTIQTQVRNAQGVPLNPGYGVSFMALTSATGVADGSVKMLALFLPNQNSFTIDGNPN